MAKSKVINTVLNLRDNMSGGLIKAARNAKKAGADIDDSMITATRRVVAFKNKAVDGIKTFAKAATGVGVAGVTALTTAFIALDGATEDFRVSQGKLLTAFAGTATGTQGARTAYAELYKILGDSDTSTEAAQALSTLAQSQQDVTKWTRVAAGVVGKFGDGISINSLFQDIGESSVSGAVTGVLADTLNWLNISEDEFNERLEATGTTAGRTTLILDTLTAAYDGYADAFYQNNTQLVKNRAYQTQVTATMAKLGEVSQTVKSGILEMLGASESGGFREGSVFAILSTQAERLSAWVQSVDFSSFAAKVDQGFAGAIETVRGVFQWFMDNRETITAVLVGIGSAVGTIKIMQFVSGVANLVNTIKGFASALAGIVATNPILLAIAAGIAAIAVAGALIYKNWDKIKAAAVTLWGVVKEKFFAIKDAVLQALAPVIAVVLEVAGYIRSFFVRAIEHIQPVMQTVFGFIQNTVIPIGQGLFEVVKKVAGLFVGNLVAAFQLTQPVMEMVFGFVRDIAVPVFGILLEVGGRVAGFLIDRLAAAFGWVLEKMEPVFGFIRDTFLPGLGDFIDKLGELRDFLVDKLLGALNTVKDVFNKVKSAVGGLIDKVKEFLGMDTSKTVKLSTEYVDGGRLAGNALGTSYWRGGLTRVNERGGEIMNLPSGTQIIPHDISARMAGGPRVTVHVTVAGNVIGNEQYADELGERIADKVIRAIDNM